MKSGRNTILHRILCLLRFLERTPVEWSIPELADIFAVDARTIHRDLVALQTTGWPVVLRGGAALERCG